MLLSHKTAIKVNNDEAIIIGHMCYAASKLWNVCNYERRNYKSLELSKFPDWYYQKSAHKDDLWYKNLPAQTAQELCKQLDGAWKSYISGLKSKKTINPKPPKFKNESTAITYLQKGIVHNTGDNIVRLSLPKQLMSFVSGKYGISEHYLFLKNDIFKNTDNIKQIKIYPPEKGKCDIIVIYEIEDIPRLPDNGHYLAIDLGLHNLMTCLDSETGETFVVGRKYLSLCHYYNKEIAKVQSVWSKIQHDKGVKYPKSSKHIRQMYTKKNNVISDYLHKVTRYIAEYCKSNDISTVVIGDITGILENNDKGAIFNQKMHGLPFAKIYIILEYKLALYGITMIKCTEAYSSQCSPLVKTVSKDTATGNKRVARGLYVDNGYVWNADAVGAYNILRLYKKNNVILSPYDIKAPFIVKVAA
jgi:putative transposase